MILKNLPFALGLALSLAASASAAQITLGQNAILNGDAESGAGSPSGDIVPVPYWTTTGQFTAVQYGASGGFPTTTDPGPVNRGNNFFAGGPSASLSTGTQILDVSNIASQISTGSVDFTLSGYLGGFSSQDDDATLSAIFLSSTATTLGTDVIGPVTASERGESTGLLYQSSTGVIPVGTTTIDFVVTLTRYDGTYNDGYADNLSFIATYSPSVPPMVAPEPSSIALLAVGMGTRLALFRFCKQRRFLAYNPFE